jgi:hypothetical protein
MDFGINGHAFDLRYESDRTAKSVMTSNNVLVHALAQKAVDLPWG